MIGRWTQIWIDMIYECLVWWKKSNDGLACTECPYSSKMKSHAREHVEKHIEGFSLECENCNRTFILKRSSLQVFVVWVGWGGRCGPINFFVTPSCVEAEFVCVSCSIHSSPPPCFTLVWDIITNSIKEMTMRRLFEKLIDFKNQVTNCIIANLPIRAISLICLV